MNSQFKGGGRLSWNTESILSNAQQFLIGLNAIRDL